MATLTFINRKDSKNVGSLGSVIAYSVQKQKTEYENANLVSGVGCMPESALADFGLTKNYLAKRMADNSITLCNPLKKAWTLIQLQLTKWR